jgi:pimeloyl-ACP methyl ester carboxylesterase
MTPGSFPMEAEAMRRFPSVRTALVVLAALVLATSAQAQLNFFESKAKSDDDIDIYFKAMGRGQRAIVFVHGWSCDGDYWREQLAHFTKDYMVITVDLAGHGKSGKGREDYTMEAFGADVAAVLYAHNVGDAVLIGHSMGGPVVVETALQAADLVRGVIGVDNFQDFTAEFPEEQANAFVAAMEADFPGTVEPWVRSMFPADADPELVDEIAKDMAAGDPEVGVSAMRNTLAWFMGGGVPQLERLSVDIVCVNSDLYPTNVEANRTIVPGFEMYLQEGVGHFLMRESPEEFNALLEKALAHFDW